LSSSAGKPLQPRHSNLHHVYPKSRIPMKYRAKILGKWMEIDVLIKAHDSFHTIFGNRTPEEQQLFLKKLCDRNEILNDAIYIAYKRAFDRVFGGKISFQAMTEVLKKWDLSSTDKKRRADKLATLLRVLNNKIKGGISIRKYKLN